MGLTFKQTDHVRSRADILMDAPENRRKKQIIMLKSAFQRMLTSVFLLSGLGFIAYCSSLYIGAFIDIGEITGSSRTVKSQGIKAAVSQMPRIKERTLLSPVLEKSAVDRVYLRRGQSILATYSLPNKSQLNLTITQCKNIPIIEIFNCKTVSEQNRSIKNETTGFVEFSAIRSGFYHFKSDVSKSQKTKLEAYFDYTVVWQRGGQKAR